MRPVPLRVTQTRTPTPIIPLINLPRGRRVRKRRMRVRKGRTRMKRRKKSVKVSDDRIEMGSLLKIYLNIKMF